ncbi:MAG: hypothetical protein Q9M92_01030 [Enterobacterales bacterium]|nr:hypothetical protein [Enterobacterales bacterium]
MAEGWVYRNINIGMGAAAASLSEMLQEPVELSLPNVELMSGEKLAKAMKKLVGEDVSLVVESFSGHFDGDAMLVFSKVHSMDLVRQLLKSEDLAISDLSEVEQEALVEIGNIILNACLGTLSNIFGKNMHYNIPFFTQGHCDDLLYFNNVDRKNQAVLLLTMQFVLEKTKIDGYLTILMDVDSMEIFNQNIEQYFDADPIV